ncbi:hypothetical protein [Streptomyces ambofaciens]
MLHETTPAGDQVEVAWNPEFLRDSFAIEDTLRPDRLVLGFETEHSWAEAVLRQCFEKITEAGRRRSSPTGRPPSSPRRPRTRSSPR